MSRRKQRLAFDQVSEFDRGRIVAYRDCELSFREIGSRVGRNQTTVMPICDRWMQDVSARTIRRRLQQSGLSARRPLIGLPLTQNHRRLRSQWYGERSMWAAELNEVVFTGESRICLQHHDGRIRVWKHRGERMLNSCVMDRRHTGHVPGIMVWGYWITLSHSASTHCRYFKQPALYLRGVGASFPSLPSGLGHNHISTG
ncbi:transposable element Tcb1 transposase [Trichonephila clavipes]|uniref:Transposable element Tcb1 transposase n=1 Tax=Trichonephila clavipes TaxID=2585209 RepID=A0A8X6VGC3_TRICX|nr:transposable element Tcb1 transposase [Trichonephila clavipes]